MTRWISCLTAFLAIACSTVPSAATHAREVRPKSVILIVGDGVGPAHVTAAKIMRGTDFQIGRLPVVGLMTTHSASSLVTDSAAAATAMATGVKTVNRTIGVDPEGKPLRNVVEAAKAAGKATGTVTTAYFWDATPASFLAHHKSRYEVVPLVEQILASGANVIAGSGKEWFGVQGRPTLVSMIEKSPFKLVTSREAMSTVKGDHLLAIFPSARDEAEPVEAPLPVLAQWALDQVSRDPDGFFLLLENEGTDGAAHKNITDEFNASMTSLDKTVGVVLDYAQKHPDVLVIFTGDHETGGLSLDVTKQGELEYIWTNKDHTGSMVPIFAFGPGSSRFDGQIDNTDLGKALLEFVGR